MPKDREPLITYTLFLLPLIFLLLVPGYHFFYGDPTEYKQASIDIMATKPSNHNLNGRFLFPTALPSLCPFFSLLSIPILRQSHPLTLQRSLQETPGPLLQIPHDRLLPRRLLPRRPRRRRQPRRSRRAHQRIPRLLRLARQQPPLHRPRTGLQVVSVHGTVEGSHGCCPG